MAEYGEGMRIKRVQGRFRGKRQVIIGTREPTNERAEERKLMKKRRIKSLKHARTDEKKL